MSWNYSGLLIRTQPPGQIGQVDIDASLIHSLTTHETRACSMYVTIQQATKLTGKSRATITRHISSGKLSKTDKGIDTAELMRVYGALIDTLDASLNDSMTTHDASQMHQNSEFIDALRAQIELLKDQVADIKTDRDHWRNQATMLLTHQPEPPKAEQPTRSRLYEKLFGRK